MAISYPDDLTVLARGKYSICGKERREQIERVAKLANTMQQHLLLALNGVQEEPTEKREHLNALRACLGNWENAWNRIDELDAERALLRAEAFGEDKARA